MPPLDEDGSKGEERRGALLVLPGGLVSKDTASAERSDPANGETEAREQLPALPSCNPLRPSSNLHMGWYRPAERINKQNDGRAEAKSSTPLPAEPSLQVDAAAGRLEVRWNRLRLPRPVMPSAGS